MGFDGVKNWTERKEINVFQKKLIFIPINKNLHWSLAVVVNPGEIERFQNKQDGESAFPCILFFDSLKNRSKEAVARQIRTWLNAEWMRLFHEQKDPFNPETMKVFAPRGEFGW